MREIGFEPVGECCEWRSCFLNPETQALLIIYVDDFKMAGPKDKLPIMWGLLGKQPGGLLLDKPKEADHFLGCTHERGTKTLISPLVSDSNAKVSGSFIKAIHRP